MAIEDELRKQLLELERKQIKLDQELLSTKAEVEKQTNINKELIAKRDEYKNEISKHKDIIEAEKKKKIEALKQKIGEENIEKYNDYISKGLSENDALKLIDVKEIPTPIINQNPTPTPPETINSQKPTTKEFRSQAELELYFSKANN